MTDTPCSPESLDAKNQQLLAEQNHVAAELIAKRDVSLLPYNPYATRIVVPKVAKNPSFTLILAHKDCHYKNLIFSALNAAYYLYFVTDEFTDNRKERFTFARHLWDFLKSYTINKSNRALLFRNFESWRVKEKGVKTQSTGLKWLNLFLLDALGLDIFAKTLTQSDVDFLHGLCETRPAPHDDVGDVNLNHWFTQHTWLRRDDVGIGHELYTRLSSPRMLMDSFRVTVENTLLHIQTCKDALIELFRYTHISADALPNIKPYCSKTESQSAFMIRVYLAKEEMFSVISDALAKVDKPPKPLVSALEVLTFSHCNPRLRTDTLNRLQSNKPLSYAIKEEGTSVLRYNRLLNCGLFDSDFIRNLASIAQVPQSVNCKVPVCQAEQLLFSWLMAYQTVQASDIPKLTLSDFKFVQRVNGRITHIESEYFKGRANSVHQVNTLSIKEPMGAAILRYLKDVTTLTTNISLTTPFKPNTLSRDNIIGKLIQLCDTTSLNHKLAAEYQKQSVTPVFLNAILALIKNGVNPRTPKAKLQEYDTITSASFFGFSHIKTSAVFAKSVTFDPTTLINLNSHTDSTERNNYLTEANEDWLNRCGRITRAVMSDLANNVFRASNADKELFESEFTKAIKAVKQRSDNTLLRMKLVTERASGRVDELGFISATQLDFEEALPDTLYIEDSPETVLKLMHYLNEVKCKHKALLVSAPEFLFATALPTAEWIECLFDDKRFSKESLKKGQSDYVRYADLLPPHFTSMLT